MNKPTPKWMLRVSGQMTPEDAGRVGMRLATTALLYAVAALVVALALFVFAWTR